MEIEAIADGYGWRCEFVRRGDRFAHVVSLVTPDQSQPWFVSAEGDDVQEWPPSPPIQQASMETPGDCPTIFGLGMAGSSHWSLSVEARQGEQQPPSLLFDIACRTKSAGSNTDEVVAACRSTYQLPADESTVGTPTLADAKKCEWEFDRYQVELTCSLAEIRASESGQLEIGPTGCDTSSDQLFRWQFCLTLRPK